MIIEARGDLVTLSGSLETNLWPSIQAAANLLLRQHADGILIDAHNLSLCTTEGAKTFLEAFNYIERHRARILVCDVPECVLNVIKTVPGVRSQVPVVATVDEGRESLLLARQTEQKASKRSNPAAPQPKVVLVALTRWTNDAPGAVALASQLGSWTHHVDTRNKKRVCPNLNLTYFLEVPRAMPVSAPCAEEERVARQKFEEVTQGIRSLGIEFQTHVARTRDIGDEVAARARAIDAELVVLSLPADSDGETDIVATIDVILQRAPCEVVLHRPKRTIDTQRAE
jgi:hypothetical protein